MQYASTSDDTWARTFFSDMKKWNLEGPDGLKYYWHCRTAVTNYVKDRINYGKRHLHGRPRKLNARDERRLCRAAAPGNLSWAKLVKQLNLPVSRRTVSRALNDSGIF